MLTNTTRLIALSLLMANTAAAAREPPAEGRTLCDHRCLRCHDTSVQTREDRLIQTPAQLRAQVARCAAGPAEIPHVPNRDTPPAAGRRRVSAFAADPLSRPEDLSGYRFIRVLVVNDSESPSYGFRHFGSAP
jgi:hypothetical protein